MLPETDWQKSIQRDQEKHYKSSTTDFELNCSQVYQHSCPKLQDYLTNWSRSSISTFFSGIHNYDDDIYINQDDYILSIKELKEKFNYTIGIALMRIEIWVEFRLEQWFNRLTTAQSDKNRFEILSRFFEDYQNAALNHYYSENDPADPIGYTRR